MIEAKPLGQDGPKKASPPSDEYLDLMFKINDLGKKRMQQQEHEEEEEEEDDDDLLYFKEDNDKKDEMFAAFNFSSGEEDDAAGYHSNAWAPQSEKSEFHDQFFW